MDTIETLDQEIKSLTQQYENALSLDLPSDEIAAIEQELTIKKNTYQSFIVQVTADDFSQLRLCSEETYDEVLLNLEAEGIPSKNYKFFEGVKVSPNPGSAQ